MAAASYENDPDRYNRLGEDWMAAARAGAGYGPAWSPEAVFIYEFKVISAKGRTLAEDSLPLPLAEIAEMQ